jgi:hypothetical protein
MPYSNVNKKPVEKYGIALSFGSGEKVLRSGSPNTGPKKDISPDFFCFMNVGLTALFT